LRGLPVPPDPTLAEQLQCMLRHYRLVCGRFGDEKGTVLMRKYACNYANGRPGARNFRANVARVSTPEEFFEVVDKFFPRDGLGSQSGPGDQSEVAEPNCCEQIDGSSRSEYGDEPDCCG